MESTRRRRYITSRDRPTFIISTWVACAQKSVFLLAWTGFFGVLSKVALGSTEPDPPTKPEDRRASALFCSDDSALHMDSTRRRRYITSRDRPTFIISTWVACAQKSVFLLAWTGFFGVLSKVAPLDGALKHQSSSLQKPCEPAAPKTEVEARFLQR